MRELKFRAWVYYGEKLKRPHYSDGGDLENFFRDHCEYDDGQCIEQYTGLKSKHGFEIYEGDILETPLGNRQIIYDKELAQYVFANGEGEVGTCEDFSHWSADECYVIGNIHQNPELLKEQS